MKFKIFIPIIIVVAAIAGGYWFLEKQLSEFEQQDKDPDLEFVEKHGIELYQDKLKRFNLAMLDDEELTVNFTSKNAQSLEEQALLNDFNLAVNGSFYRGSVVEAEHSGLLKIKGELIAQVVEDPQRQLTHVVIYNHNNNSVQLLATDQVNPSDYDENFTLFQTGPVIIENNKIQRELIDDSVNGNSNSLRTLFGFTESGEKFLVVTRVSFKLNDLAERLKELEIFQGKTLNVINLDGGSSTAMYVDGLEEFSYLDSKRLPMVIGVEEEEN